MIGKKEVPKNILAKFLVVTLCLAVVWTFSFLCCVKTYKKFSQNYSDVECTDLRTYSVTPGTTCGGKISLFIKKNSDADVYERSVQGTDARSQHNFLLASVVNARAGLCITKAESERLVEAYTETTVNMIGTMLVDDDSLSQWQIAIVFSFFSFLQFP